MPHPEPQPYGGDEVVATILLLGSAPVFITGGGTAIYAVDKRSGATLWQFDLGRRAYAVPMTYRTSAGTQYVVVATGSGADAELVAFALH